MKHATLWAIPNELETGFQQYLNFFSDFVKKLIGEDIVLNVHNIIKILSRYLHIFLKKIKFKKTNLNG